MTVIVWQSSWVIVTFFGTTVRVIITQQVVTQFYVTSIEHLETIAIVQKSASDCPYFVRNETLCCNTVIVTVIVVTVIVTVIVVIVVIGVILVIWRG